MNRRFFLKALGIGAAVGGALGVLGFRKSVQNDVPEDLAKSQLFNPWGDGPAFQGRVLNVPEDYETIQLAISKAGTNDMIIVRPGVHLIRSDG